MSHAKGKVKTAAAVTSVLAVSGGVATAFHLHQDGLRNSAEAASQDSNTSAAAAAANALAARAATTAANRDLARPTLTTSSSSSSAPTTAPTTATSSTPPAPSSSTSTTTPTPIPLPTKTSTSTPTKTATPTPTKTTTTPTSSSSSSSGSTNMGYDATPAQAKAIAEAVVPSGQFACFADIIERESSWNIYATNPSSGAYGLGQALPGYKMASMGSAWRNSALIQIKWALSYMNGRYGSPCAAWTFWQAHDWY